MCDNNGNVHVQSAYNHSNESHTTRPANSANRVLSGKTKTYHSRHQQTVEPVHIPSHPAEELLAVLVERRGLRRREGSGGGIAALCVEEAIWHLVDRMGVYTMQSHERSRSMAATCIQTCQMHPAGTSFGIAMKLD